MQLAPDTIGRLEASFGAVRPKADKLVNVFYDKLFQKAPAIRLMFPKEFAEQKKKLQAALAMVAGSIRKPDALAPQLRETCARHVGYGAQESHYALVRDTMLEALASVAGPAWSPQLTQDWTQALDLVAGLMIEGARSAPGQGRVTTGYFPFFFEPPLDAGASAFRPRHHIAPP